jgi:hypothetical protein
MCVRMLVSVGLYVWVGVTLGETWAEACGRQRTIRIASHAPKLHRCVAGGWVSCTFRLPYLVTFETRLDSKLSRSSRDSGRLWARAGGAPSVADATKKIVALLLRADHVQGRSLPRALGHDLNNAWNARASARWRAVTTCGAARGGGAAAARAAATVEPQEGAGRSRRGRGARERGRRGDG